ncbi:FAD:protein FMN transferase [Pseudomonas abietaniphila]|nr:FAD:protein FMN transferase [Pseudomonas abietaniphila]
MCIEAQRYSLNGETMGTRYTAVFYGPAGFDTAVIARRLSQAVTQVDEQMSTWRPHSNLNQLNAADLQHWVDVPRQLACVLACAERVRHESEGAFDIAVGDLSSAWGFGPNAPTITAETLEPLPRSVMRVSRAELVVDLERNRVCKHQPLVLDLNGIAKGFAVDEMARCLNEAGITRYLVGIDGEMRASGVKPDHTPWVIAVEKPCRGMRDVMGVMELADAAVATSGDYRHWVDVAGRSYAHTMNPVSGLPASNNLASVSVIASSCMLADAWATALMVLGETQGVNLARQRRMDALFIVREGQELREISVVGGKLQTSVETE